MYCSAVVKMFLSPIQSAASWAMARVNAGKNTVFGAYFLQSIPSHMRANFKHTWTVPLLFSHGYSTPAVLLERNSVVASSILRTAIIPRAYVLLFIVPSSAVVNNSVSILHRSRIQSSSNAHPFVVERISICRQSHIRCQLRVHLPSIKRPFAANPTSICHRSAMMVRPTAIYYAFICHLLYLHHPRRLCCSQSNSPKTYPVQCW